ncbi:DUF1960-domain-containing protein [Eremomyces bilateralis CBS 781.70]|uniref:DUF1960-domain-containing protein n=1 Tax=Eremomyces bilateralis CBS 781.70 TaxID=1392243 RepID=A0A6G1FV81_9PEZI|nr:DUF1960-domain-containing protein [Eremomyces bilateralis CBS 781.70]KAF1809616.1 DUF1960-domain-containing protein [Eremomyces bilateralis CBS 781.70]
MVRADGYQTKVHYQGRVDDFIVYAESVAALQKWKEDKSTPLVSVVDSFQIFVSHKQGSQGHFDRASNASLENEFGTHDDTEVVQKILESGAVQEVKGSPKQGDTNPNNGGALGSN